MAETKKLLNSNGHIIVNSFGYIDGSIGKAMRSIYKTFLNENFKVAVLSTDPNPDKNNLLFFASSSDLKIPFDFIPKEKIDLNDAVVLTEF
ncbi:MAG: hypothetical protein IPH32_19185 [Bacteroidetes bacterium]|nr:hypothetical protein [Bacteroidota bacterium]